MTISMRNRIFASIDKLDVNMAISEFSQMDG